MRKFVDLVENTAQFCAKFLGEAAASYRTRLTEYNNRIAAEARAAQEQQTKINLQPEYHSVAEMLAEAINNTADATHFVAVPSANHLKLGNGIGPFDGVWLMQFRARRFRGHNVTAEDSQRILQHEMDRICGYNGYMHLLLHVSFAADSVVKITVGCAADIARRRAEKAKEIL